jgi:hypothetical protein
MRKIKATEERFKEKVKMVESGCHEWQSTMHRDGYGKFWLDGKQIMSHRVGYMIANGGIPEGKMVLHKCDNRKCVNPDHLYAGTPSQNVRDKVKRFKGIWGFMKHPYEKVLEVRSLYNEGLTQTAIAGITGISQSHISKMVRGTSRKLN